MRKIILLSILFLLFIPLTFADTLSFGSVGTNKRVILLPGEKITFKVDFFNYGETPLFVQVSTEGSDEIRKVVEPRYFVLQNSKEVDNPFGLEEWVVLGDKYVKAVPVYITLKVPENISELSTHFFCYLQHRWFIHPQQIFF